MKEGPRVDILRTELIVEHSVNSEAFMSFPVLSNRLITLDYMF